MAPRAVAKENNILGISGVLDENDAETVDGGLQKRQEGYAGRRKVKLVWRNIILFVALHVGAVYGLWLLLTAAQWKTVVFGKFVTCFHFYRLINLNFRSYISVFHQWLRNHRRSASFMGSSIVQSQVAFGIVVDNF